MRGTDTTFLIWEARVSAPFLTATVISASPISTPFCLLLFRVSLIMDDMDVDNAPNTTKAGKEKDNDKKRFEVKKVSKHRRGMISNDPNNTSSGTQCLCGRGVCHSLLWNLFGRLIRVLDIVVDNCAICRNHIMDLCSSAILLQRCLLSPR